MRPAESFIEQPVRSLQTMLRVIAENDKTLPTVIPDGIYGQDTIRAVSAFQQKYSIPVTGITDNITWDKIVSEYEDTIRFMLDNDCKLEQEAMDLKEIGI